MKKKLKKQKPFTESGTSPPSITTRKCSMCHEVKPLADFHRNRTVTLGRHYACKPCIRASRAKYHALRREEHRVYSAKYRAEHLEERRAYDAKYKKTFAGVATSLRAEHGLDRPTSLKWAVTLLHDDTRCACCGVPNHVLQRMKVWKIGGAQRNRRLTLDHVVPGDNNGSLRPLCYSCNALRGAAELSDGEVLLQMRWWYREMFSLRKLYWLNTRVVDGICVGGTLHRNEHMKRKMACLAEGSNNAS